ncbi:MAG: DUF2071 domain-containing protein [Chitinophagaceae bacterium]
MMNFLTARWENLIMVNYEIDPGIMQPWLPAGTELDYHNGKTYVSLVGFLFIKSKLFGIPIPCLGTFEEVNLRFYVTRKGDGIIKRGVVFINETVPYKAVAWLANKLYKERYTAIPTKHSWRITTESKQVDYYWNIKNNWNYIKVNAAVEKEAMQPGGMAEFIFEHYYGYTKVSERSTEEYKVEHPRWRTNKVNSVDINCDFEEMYGKPFAHLSGKAPSSVMLAEGSAIAVKWKREKLSFA